MVPVIDGTFGTIAGIIGTFGTYLVSDIKLGYLWYPYIRYLTVPVGKIPNKKRSGTFGTCR